MMFKRPPLLTVVPDGSPHSRVVLPDLSRISDPAVIDRVEANAGLVDMLNATIIDGRVASYCRARRSSARRLHRKSPPLEDQRGARNLPEFNSQMTAIERRVVGLALFPEE